MSENITPDEFGWKLDYERYDQHEWSFGDGDVGPGATLVFRNATIPNALVSVHTGVIDKRERDGSYAVDEDPEGYTSPYFVEELWEFIIFKSPEHEEEVWSDLVYGEGSYMAYSEEADAHREAVRMVGFAHDYPADAFEWDGTIEGFKR
jgi:hypothetical protein